MNWTALNLQYPQPQSELARTSVCSRELTISINRSFGGNRPARFQFSSRLVPAVKKHPKCRWILHWQVRVHQSAFNMFSGVQIVPNNKATPVRRLQTPVNGSPRNPNRHAPYCRSWDCTRIVTRDYGRLQEIDQHLQRERQRRVLEDKVIRERSRLRNFCNNEYTRQRTHELLTITAIPYLHYNNTDRGATSPDLSALIISIYVVRFSPQMMC